MNRYIPLYVQINWIFDVFYFHLTIFHDDDDDDILYILMEFEWIIIVRVDSN